jgi:hypothetical protein
MSEFRTETVETLIPTLNANHYSGIRESCPLEVITCGADPRRRCSAARQNVMGNARPPGLYQIDEKLNTPFENALLDRANW